MESAQEIKETHPVYVTESEDPETLVNNILDCTQTEGKQMVVNL